MTFTGDLEPCNSGNDKDDQPVFILQFIYILHLHHEAGIEKEWKEADIATAAIGPRFLRACNTQRTYAHDRMH